MNSCQGEQIKIPRVSLQICPEGSLTPGLSHNRASLCYSANLKRRTQALNAQRYNMNQILQKASTLLDNPGSATKKSTNEVAKTKKYSNPLLKASAPLSQKLFSSGNKAEKVGAKIQLITKPLLARKQEIRGKSAAKSEIRIMKNYDTITSKVFDESNSYKPIDRKSFSQTCPGFAKSKKISDLIKQSKQTKQKPAQQNQAPGQKIQARAVTAPNAASACSLAQKATKQRSIGTKQQYRTNLVNLSEHFAKMTQKSGIYPQCKKLTMSSLNKYYQICIEEIKQRETKNRNRRVNPEHDDQQWQHTPNYRYGRSQNLKTDLSQTIQILQTEPATSFQPNPSAKKSKLKVAQYFHKVNTMSHSMQRERAPGSQAATVPVLTATRVTSAVSANKEILMEIQRSLESDDYLLAVCSKKELVQRAAWLMDPMSNCSAAELKRSTLLVRDVDSRSIEFSPVRMKKAKSFKSTVRDRCAGKVQNQLRAWQSPEQNQPANEAITEFLL